MYLLSQVTCERSQLITNITYGMSSLVAWGHGPFQYPIRYVIVRCCKLQCIVNVFMTIQSLWYLTGVSETLLPKRLSNFKAIRLFNCQYPGFDTYKTITTGPIALPEICLWLYIPAWRPGEYRGHRRSLPRGPPSWRWRWWSQRCSMQTGSSVGWEPWSSRGPPRWRCRWKSEIMGISINWLIKWLAN